MHEPVESVDAWLKDKLRAFGNDVADGPVYTLDRKLVIAGNVSDGHRGPKVTYLHGPGVERGERGGVGRVATQPGETENE